MNPHRATEPAETVPDGRTKAASKGRARYLRWLPALGLTAVLLLAPFALNPSQVLTYTVAGLYAIVALGLSLLMGFAGQISIGHAAFFGTGAYVAGILSVNGLSPWISLLAAPLITAALTTLLGFPLLRLRGHYLAFATLAVHIIMLALVANLEGLTGGDLGLTGIPLLSVGSAPVGPAAYAVLVWAVVLAALLVARNLMRSRPGRGLQALASHENAAGSLGVPVFAYKLRVFALSGALAGLSGGLYAFLLGYLSPSAFPILLSVGFVVMVAIGGLGSVFGALIGAVGVMVFLQVLEYVGSMPGMPTSAPVVFSSGFYALVLIGTMLFMPRGVVPAVTSLWRRRGGE